VRFASRRIFQVTLRKGRITSGNLLSVFMARMITCGHIGKGLDLLMNFLIVMFSQEMPDRNEYICVCHTVLITSIALHYQMWIVYQSP